MTTRIITGVCLTAVLAFALLPPFCRRDRRDMIKD